MTKQEQPNLYIPDFQDGSIDEPLIGQEVYAITDITNPNPREFYQKMQIGFNSDLASSLESRFHNNTVVSGMKIFGDKRPLSAYFTLLNHDLLIEWGEINPNGEAKLHDFLNRELDIYGRRDNGAIVRSGHYGEISLPFTDAPVQAALIDSLLHGFPVNRHSEDFSIVLTMINHEILPVTSDGYPVQIEEFNNK